MNLLSLQENKLPQIMLMAPNSTRMEKFALLDDVEVKKVSILPVFRRATSKVILVNPNSGKKSHLTSI